MNFERDVKRLTGKYRERMKATFRSATEAVVEEAETPRGDGGRFRIDTGFMRASGGSALNNTPSGPTSNPGGQSFTDGATLTGAPLAVTLAQWDIGDTVVYGWSANYARPREAKDGFVRGAVEKWPEIVSSAAKRVKARI